jgi:hypothetical protein
MPEAALLQPSSILFAPTASLSVFAGRDSK